MLPASGKFSLYDVFMETPAIKPIKMKDYMDYYDLSGKTGMDSFYNKEERLLKEVLVFKSSSNLNFQLANRKPQTPELIFNTWGRIKGNLFYANKAEADAAADAEASAWYFQNNQIYMPLNVEPINGFVSNLDFDNYTFECTVTSDNADNDTIGLIAAFHRESSNNYYICFYANMSGTLPYTGIGISYQGADTTQDTWANSTGLLYSGGEFGNTQASAGFGWSGKTRRLKIVRTEDILKFYYSEIDSELLPVVPQFTLNLNSDPRLLKFRGKHKYGYMTNSQPYSTYKNIFFDGGEMDETVIIDSTNKTVYRFNFDNNNWELQTESIQNALGFNRIILNPEGLDYGENYWYIISSTDIISKGIFALNTEPDLAKIKAETQFINIISQSTEFISASALSGNIAAIQRRNLLLTPIKTNIPIQSYTTTQFTFTPENFNLLDITNLSRSAIVLDNSKVYSVKYGAVNKLLINKPLKWYLLNIGGSPAGVGSVFGNGFETTVNASDIYADYFYNGKFYFILDTSSLGYTVMEISESNLMINAKAITPHISTMWSSGKFANNFLFPKSMSAETNSFVYMIDSNNIAVHSDITASFPKFAAEFQDTIATISFFKGTYYMFYKEKSCFVSTNCLNWTRVSPNISDPNTLGESTTLAYEFNTSDSNSNIMVMLSNVHHASGAVVSNYLISTTTNGTTWTRRMYFSDNKSSEFELFFDQSRNIFRLIRSTIASSVQTNTFYESADGITWTLVKTNTISTVYGLSILSNPVNGKVVFFAWANPNISRPFQILDENMNPITTLMDFILSIPGGYNLQSNSPRLTIGNTSYLISAEYKTKFYQLNF